MATVSTFNTVGSTNWVAPSGVTSVSYLVVGGGGGGGNGYDTGGGGGGGGGMVLSGSLTVSPGTSYTVTVGAGGSGGADTRSNRNGSAGGDSVFATITANGGDFGNGSRTVEVSQGAGGAAQNGSTTSARGGDGGGNGSSASGGSGGGGGGAGGSGSNGVSGSGGAGGSGISSSLSGSSVTYGIGGAGARGNFNTTEGANGSANTGNGGGGGGAASFNSGGGGDGGSGIVILSYTATASLPCILEGTPILTNHGYKEIETITDDDLIQTSDGRYIKSFIRSFSVPSAKHNLPYKIPKDYISNNTPSQDTYLSPEHAIIVSNSTIFIPKHMNISQMDTSKNTIKYYHMEVPNFETDFIIANNMVIEGFGNDYFIKTKKTPVCKVIHKDSLGRLHIQRKYI